MRMMGDADDFLLVNLNVKKITIRGFIPKWPKFPRVSKLSYVQRPLQFPRRRAEAVEDEVLADAVDPLAARRDLTRDEVSALALSGGEGAHDLTGHVDDGDVVGTVAHDDLVGVH